MTLQFAISHFRERATEQALPQISRDTLNEIAVLIETLLAENERLKADKERLDWLEESKTGGVCFSVDSCQWVFIYEPVYRGDTLRQAIDAARAAEKGQTP